MICEDVTYHEGLFVAVTGLDAAGVEEFYCNEENPVGDVRQDDTERLLVGTAALTKGRLLDIEDCLC